MTRTVQLRRYHLVPGTMPAFLEWFQGPLVVPALATALTRLIGDAALRKKLGAAAQRMHRERLEITPYCARLVEIWQDAAADPLASRAA